MKIKATIAGLALATFGAVGSASAAPIDFAGGNDGSADGVNLSCYVPAVIGSVSCSVTTNTDGLGVDWNRVIGDTQPGQVDGLGRDESLTISFGYDRAWNTVIFDRWDNNDDAAWAADGGASGSYGGNAGVLNLSGYVSSQLTITAFGSGDNFTIRSIDVAGVPLPAAGFLMLAGLGGLAVARRRKG